VSQKKRCSAATDWHRQGGVWRLVAEPSRILLLLQTEDRPVMKERVTRMREHHPVEKEFVVSAGQGQGCCSIWEVTHS
jgi:hypothetical protein